MALRISVDVWGLAFLTSLGLGACGGSTDDGDGSGGSAGSTAGTSASGGSGGSLASGGTSSGGSAGSTSGGSGGAPSPYPCVNAERVVVDGQDTGWEQCEGGFMHRAEQKECPFPERDEPFTCGEPNVADCETDADCTDRPYGRCGYSDFGGAGCYCSYGCKTDDDCGDNQVCVCGASGGYCATTMDCTSDADCPGNLMCTSYVSDPGCGGTAFACQTAQDECGGSADCSSDNGFEECTYDGEKHVCQQAACAIGRPFLVGGAERLAPSCARADWCAALEPSVDSLDAWTRARLSEHWTRTGLMEHASVAAFARFALQLLNLGAPPELLFETQAAMADETRHAEACFALASAYAGCDIGPGRLDLESALEDQSLAEVVRLALREGCIGETVAALEAAESRAFATDPAVRQVLDVVTADETRHAALAWRFVRWALTQDRASVEAVIAEELSAPVSGEAAGESAIHTATGESVLASHGLLDPNTRAEIRRKVMASVVRPGLEALLSEQQLAA